MFWRMQDGKALWYTQERVNEFRRKDAEAAKRYKLRKPHMYKQWFERNRLRQNAKTREWCKKRYHSNIAAKVRQLLATRLHTFVKSGAGTMDYLGCSIDELRAHLETCFQVGMSWENYGRTGWHIDHIRPCASFNLADEVQARKCFHWTNLQPLWAFENVRKNSSWRGVKYSTRMNRSKGTETCNQQSASPENSVSAS